MSPLVLAARHRTLALVFAVLVAGLGWAGIVPSDGWPHRTPTTQALQ